MATYESKKYATIPIAATQIADGSVSNTEFQTVDTSSSINTQLGTKAALAGATFTGGVRINDSQNLNIGSGTDLVISHDTNNSKINNTTGELRIAGDSIKLMNQAEDETHLTATADGAVGLRHNNIEKLATSATGVTISGTLAATAVTGDGSGLSNLPAGPPGPSGPTGPTGPGGASGTTTFISDFDATTRDLATGTQPASGTAPQYQNGTAQTGASVTINVTNLSTVQVTYGFSFWQATGSTDQNYVTSYSTAQCALLEDSSVISNYLPSSDEIKLIDNYFPSGNPNGGLYARRAHQVSNSKVVDVSSATGNKTFAVTMRSQFGTNVSGAYSSNNYNTTAAFSGSGTAPFPVRSYSSYISVIGA